MRPVAHSGSIGYLTPPPGGWAIHWGAEGGIVYALDRVA